MVEDSGDDLTFIVEVIRDGKKTRLTRSVVQEQYPVASHPPRVQVKYCPTALFDPAVSRKRISDIQDLNVRRRRLNDEPDNMNVNLPEYARRGDYTLIRTNDRNEGDEIEDESGNIEATFALPPLCVQENSNILTEVEEHVRVVEKGDLIGLNREFDYSTAFQPNPGVAEVGGLTNEDRTLDVSNIKIEEVLMDDFSDKVNEILGPTSTPDLIDNTITIVEHQYHARSLQYLVHDTWDCQWRVHGDLKADEPLLVARYINMNKDMFSKCMFRLKTWAQGILEAKMEVLIDDFSDKVNEILGPTSTPDLIDDTITIVGHQYHARSLEYLVHDAWDCEWRAYEDLKVDEPLLVARYINMNKDMFSKCAFRLKTWAQGVLEAKVGCVRRLRAVTTVKSKKGRTQKMKYGVTIPLNPNNIEEVDRMAGNAK